MRICTIATRGFLPQARVLVDSFLRHHPGGLATAMVVDDPQRRAGAADEPFEVVLPQDLGLPRFEAMAAMYDATELCCALKPVLARTLLDRAGEPLILLDCDMRFYAPVEDLFELAAAHGVVATPHFRHGYPDDGRLPSYTQILSTGAFNTGFLGLAPGGLARRLLTWWADRLAFDCVFDPLAGQFREQRWFDLVPVLFPEVELLHDATVNTGLWNLHERPLVWRDGEFVVDGRPLRLFHFSGFDPQRPDRLSRHENRHETDREPALARLCAGYAREWLAHERGARPPYAFATLPDGTPLTPFLRKCYRAGERAGAFSLSPFTPEGAEEFYGWLREPARVVGGGGLTRLCMLVYDEKLHLREDFPGPGPYARELIDFVRTHAAPEYGLPEVVLPAAPGGGVRAAPGIVEPAATPGGGDVTRRSTRACLRAAILRVPLLGWMIAWLVRLVALPARFYRVIREFYELRDDCRGLQTRVQVLERRLDAFERAADEARDPPPRGQPRAAPVTRAPSDQR